MHDMNIRYGLQINLASASECDSRSRAGNLQSCRVWWEQVQAVEVVLHELQGSKGQSCLVTVRGNTV